VIGYGSPQQDTAQVHGEPLGTEGVRATKEAFDWPQEPAFLVPTEVKAHMHRAIDRGREAEQEWQSRLQAYVQAYPAEASQLQQQWTGKLPADWDADLDDLFSPDDPPLATRNASGQVLNALVPQVHALTGGSADLAPSTKTIMAKQGDFSWSNYCGHNLHFGVREHAMGAIAGGMALHGGVIPYTATFLTFADYMRPPMRLAALMGLRVIYIFTHDSIGLGEDGPTHQPIEHVMNLRTVPNLTVIRPADAAETVEAWRAALLNTDGPTVLILTRQKLPMLDRDQGISAHHLHRGGYILWESAGGQPDIILMGTGSELQLALKAGRQLAAAGHQVRVVSLPSWKLFERQAADYRESVLPSAVQARIAVEAGSTLGWERYVGLDGVIVGLDHFGASAPAATLYEKFGLSVQNVIVQAKSILK